MDLDHHTGASLDGWAHVVQSIETVLVTRIDSRVFARSFGADVPAMVDAPMNDAGVMALYMSVAEALARWEPRFELSDVTINADAGGKLTLNLSGSYYPNAHLGDFDTVSDEIRTVKISADRVDNWSLAA